MKKYFYVKQPTAIIVHKRVDGNILTRTLFKNRITEKVYEDVEQLLELDKCKKAWQHLKNAFKNEVELNDQYSLNFKEFKVF